MITPWQLPPQPYKLAPREMHIWRVVIPRSLHSLSGLKSLLNEEELTKAGSYYFDRDRNCYIIARGVLRTLLSSYLNTSPLALQFTYNQHGKPFLLNSPLYFNVSHSKDIILIAISNQEKTGVDIEHMDSSRDYLKIAQRFFSPGEYQALIACSKENQAEAFFNIWTAKEAYIKAVGKGLWIDLNSFAVSVWPTAPACLLHSADETIADWHLQRFNPWEGYKAAYAVSPGIEQINFYEWVKCQ